MATPFHSHFQGASSAGAKDKAHCRRPWCRAKGAEDKAAQAWNSEQKAWGGPLQAEPSYLIQALAPALSLLQV